MINKILFDLEDKIDKSASTLSQKKDMKLLLKDIEKYYNDKWRWNPVTKKPPKENKIYLVSVKNIFSDKYLVVKCRWTNNSVYSNIFIGDTWGWCVYDIPSSFEIVGWMDMPEPYKKIINQ